MGRVSNQSEVGTVDGQFPKCNLSQRLRSLIMRGEEAMTDPVENLILDLIEWVARRERTYKETMDAWRTSCPRLTVWEDTTEQGLVETTLSNGHSIVRPTSAGLALLQTKRPAAFSELQLQLNAPRTN